MSKEKYLLSKRITEESLAKLTVKKDNATSQEMMRFITDYVNDAKHYEEKEDFATALEAIAYAHGILDGGVMAGYFEIEGYHLEEVK